MGAGENAGQPPPIPTSEQAGTVTVSGKLGVDVPPGAFHIEGLVAEGLPVPKPHCDVAQVEVEAA